MRGEGTRSKKETYIATVLGFIRIHDRHGNNHDIRIRRDIIIFYPLDEPKCGPSSTVLDLHDAWLCATGTERWRDQRKRFECALKEELSVLALAVYWDVSCVGKNVAQSGVREQANCCQI
jgi:hypothetical protein